MQARIEELALMGWGGAQIERELQQDPEVADRLPTVRTIQSIVKEFQSIDTDEDIWRIDQMKPKDARIVLSVLAEVAYRYDWQESLSKRLEELPRIEAEWIVRLQRMFTDLSAWGAFTIGTTYARRERANEPTTDLDYFLTFTPWRADFRDYYQELTDSGILPPAPALLRINVDKFSNTDEVELLKAFNDLGLSEQVARIAARGRRDEIPIYEKAQSIRDPSIAAKEKEADTNGS